MGNSEDTVIDAAAPPSAAAWHRPAPAPARAPRVATPQLPAPPSPEATALARSALDPTIQAAATAAACYLYATGEDLDLPPLVAALAEQVDLAAQGDLARGEAALAAQATTLDAIFQGLVRRALKAQFFESTDRYLRLAFRAQSQSRATWETLAATKNPPPVGYLRQTNIACGPQQVNTIAPSKLSESPDGQ